jgi:hypothetical protein
MELINVFKTKMIPMFFFDYYCFFDSILIIKMAFIRGFLSVFIKKKNREEHLKKKVRTFR